jgi:hypothetical protein
MSARRHPSESPSTVSRVCCRLNKINNLNNMINYTHSTKEVIQFIKFLMGELNIPIPYSTLCFRTGMCENKYKL